MKWKNYCAPVDRGAITRFPWPAAPRFCSLRLARITEREGLGNMAEDSRAKDVGIFLVGCIIGVSAGIAIGIFIHPLIFAG